MAAKYSFIYLSVSLFSVFTITKLVIVKISNNRRFELK